MQFESYINIVHLCLFVHEIFLNNKVQVAFADNNNKVVFIV